VKVAGVRYRTIWLAPGNDKIIQVIDQRYLPFRFVVEDISSVEEMAVAIKEMHVRGAGLIGVAAGFGMYLAVCNDPSDEAIAKAADLLCATRPTAVNLSYAVKRQLTELLQLSSAQREHAAKELAQVMADEDAAYCRRIGEHGSELLGQLAAGKAGKPLNILTHCNAGWLAFVDYGSATSPIYAAHTAGMPVHIWVDETRPRNQGSKLTAWELLNEQVPHTLIADNTGGLLMQRGEVDLVIVGSDRATYTGDVANKVGTYLKALAAKDNNVPFYVALPSTTFDWQMRDGLSEIQIEERGGEEVMNADGWNGSEPTAVSLAPAETPAANFAFDVTPRRLITGLITERGICEANEASIAALFPEDVRR
jgi:methylthioribose-1-phosphate isomerase